MKKIIYLVWINGNVTFSALLNAHLRQETSGELVTAGQLESAPVHLQLVANIEVINGVELVIVRWWQWYAVATDQCT